MPTQPGILGFSNKWYPDALKRSNELQIGEVEIRAVTSPYFLGTKLEAFYGRGENDYVMSRDIEDIVAVLDGRLKIVEEISQAEMEIRGYLAERFTSLVSDNLFRETLPGHVPGDKASQGRLPLIEGKMSKIARMNR